jgi:hypothetical protein
MNVKILIPVKPHIRHYLLITHGEHLLLSENGYIPSFILGKLRKPEKKNSWQIKPSADLIDGKTFLSFPVYVSESYFFKYGGYIGEKAIKSFNNAVDDLLREEMYRWCHHPNSTDMVVDFNIQRFLDWYGFPADVLPFDNMKRWYYRERLRIQERRHTLEPFTPDIILALKADFKEGKTIDVSQLEMFKNAN